LDLITIRVPTRTDAVDDRVKEDHVSSSEPPSTGSKVRDSAFLGHFRTPFPRLTGTGERDLGSTFDRLAELLAGNRVGAAITFSIVPGENLDADPARSWSLRLGEQATTVSAERDERPDLEVILAEQTWWELAEGSVAPLEAFGRGRLRVLGDVRVARRFAGVLERVR
jgi:hypothetical protein